MWLRLAALAVFAAAPCLQAAAQSPEILTLDDAFARVAQTHPDLRLVDSQRGLLSAEFDRAALRPAYVAGIAIENALGTGSARGFDEAEIGLTRGDGFDDHGGGIAIKGNMDVRALAQEAREVSRHDAVGERGHHGKA